MQSLEVSSVRELHIGISILCTVFSANSWTSEYVLLKFANKSDSSNILKIKPIFILV